MKSLVVGFSVFVLWTLLTYAVGAFVPLEPNPLLWTEDGRAGFAIFGVVLGLWFGVISGVLSRAGGS